MPVRSASLTVVLDAMPQSAAVLDSDSTILHVNRAWRQFSHANGGGPRDALGLRYLDACDEGAAAAVLQAIAGVPARHVYPCHAPGRPRWFELQANPMDDGLVLVVHHEVTDAVRLRRRFDSLDTAFLDLNTRAETLEITGCWHEISGLTSHESSGLGWLDCLDPEIRPTLFESLRHEPRAGADPGPLSIVCELADGDRWVEIKAWADHDGPIWIGWRLTFDDVTEQMRTEVRAATDALTGCLNRPAFAATVDSWWPDARDVAVLFIDLDDFKQINDRYGHQTGDLVLRTVGRRLLGVTRESDAVGRYGGDEFIVASRDMHASDVEAYARRVEATLGAPIHADDDILTVGTSVGYATRESGDDMTSLFERADRSMYDRKRERKRRSG